MMSLKLPHEVFHPKSPEDFPAGFQSSNLIPCRSPAMEFVPKDCAEALHLRCRNIQTPSEILEES